MKLQRRNQSVSYVPAATAAFTIVGGAAGYIDTDVSGTTGTDIQRLWLIDCIVAGFATQDVGVRPHGSATDVKASQAISTWISQVDATGHLDLYRGAADAVYFIKGYLV